MENTEYFVKLGVDVEILNDGQSTPLHMASSLGGFEIVKFLVSRGADINRIDSCGWNSVFFSVEHNHIEITKYLLERGAKINIKSIDRGMTPLHIAARLGDYSA